MRKIGKINGKVVVAGDKNLVTANQIHYEEKDGNITLSERRGGELNSVTGSGNSSNSNLGNTDIKCYEYIRINGEDLIMLVGEIPDLINIMVEQRIPLPNVLCAYGSNETSRGEWKALVDLPMDKAFMKYSYIGSGDFEYGLTGGTKCFGYIFNNMATSTSEGVIGSPFTATNMLKSIIDKDIVDALGINLCIFLVYMIISQDPNAQGNINEVLREIINVMEFKEIPLTEYYTTQYQKAKEHYDFLEPVS